ncbi:MAG TPA: hypothetical protein VK870_08135 [Ignavibacteriaceae bacterium]|nr:hypothetical protein [Ignavibacteriaceae bacterium]
MMNRHYFFLILWLLSVDATAQTVYQADSPEWLVNQFFSAANFPDRAKYFTDEMAQQLQYPTIGEELQGQATIKFREIHNKNLDAVFSVNISTQNDQKDFYCYLKNEDGWKISAIRSFIIPVYYHQLADSILNDKSLPASEKWIAHSIRLLAGTDEKLKENLKLNFTEFKDILARFLNEPGEEIKPMLQQHYLSSVFKPDQLAECVYFSIMEINYIEAGYIYCTDKTKIPPINPGDFILVEEIVKDWYLYRRN